MNTCNHGSTHWMRFAAKYFLLVCLAALPILGFAQLSKQVCFNQTGNAVLYFNQTASAVSYSSESHPQDDNKIRNMGTKVGYITDGTSITFAELVVPEDNVPTAIEIKYSSAGAGGRVKFVAEGYGSDRTLGITLGEFDLQPTGGWDDFRTVTFPVPPNFEFNYLRNTLPLRLEFKNAATSGYLFDIVSFKISNASQGASFADTVLRPLAYDEALRNPLMGFTTGGGIKTGSSAHEWATLAHVYLRWNDLENSEQDGIDKIIQVSNDKFGQGPANNIKVIPRVYLHWSGDDTYWPSDMKTYDYTSQQFQQRVVRLIQRLGQAWNDDPRVGFIELGIFGKWGEHHSPSPTPELQKLVGDAMRDAFPNKKVSVRHAWDQFRGQGFGEYWDSWAHQDQMWPHGNEIAKLNRDEGFYLKNYVGGEVAYDWGNSNIQPGSNPTDSVSDPVHRDFVINSIRWLHGTQLRWIDGYDKNNATARAGAAMIQKAFGYRFVLEGVEFNRQVRNGQLPVKLAVSNQGSAPFYYTWPVEVALHDPVTKAVRWSARFANADIRTWTPGSGWTAPEFQPVSGGGWPHNVVRPGWSSQPQRWSVPPAVHNLSETFNVDLPQGQYVLTVAVLDPAGMKPSLRFATSQYWTGGRHPIGMVGVGQDGGPLPASLTFDNLATDRTLHYSYP